MSSGGILSIEGGSSTRKRLDDAAALAVPGGACQAMLVLDRLPFVGVRGDGQKSYWMMPALAEGESQQLRARTYAAWFLIYAEANGPAARKWLIDRIEREMPSRYPMVDRVFLSEVAGRS